MNSGRNYCAFANKSDLSDTGKTAMLKKLTIAAALAVFATGCTTVRIFINGEKVIDDRLALLGGDGEFHGAYGGQEVIANCSSKAGLAAAKTRCAVFIDQRRASTLSL